MSENHGDKQVSVSWKYLANLLIIVLIAGFGWFDNTVWARQTALEEKVAEIPLLRQSIDLLTRSVDRLTTRFDTASAKHEK